METRNARITATMLGFEDHGIMSCMVTLDYGGTSQGFGGYGLDSYDEATKRRVGTAYGCEFIKRILETVGVQKWEQLVGKHVRAVGTSMDIAKIGHIVEDRWFEPRVDLDAFTRAAELARAEGR